jgi:steroid delta-isomerase-like uncharacterized protein
MGSDADLVQRLTEEVFLKGEVSAIDELLGDDFVSHDPPPGLPPTKDGFRQLAAMVVGAFSDIGMEYDELVDTADGRVVDNWAKTGTHTAEAFGVPATGQTIRIRGMEIWRCADGKIVEHWGSVDMSDFFEKAQAALA